MQLLNSISAPASLVWMHFFVAAISSVNLCVFANGCWNIVTLACTPWMDLQLANTIFHEKYENHQQKCVRIMCAVHNNVYHKSCGVILYQQERKRENTNLWI